MSEGPWVSTFIENDVVYLRILRPGQPSERIVLPLRKLAGLAADINRDLHFALGLAELSKRRS